jgi:hypothetical protein
LTAIRDNPAPYSQINRIEPLLNTVETVNGQLAATEREIALQAIGQKLAEIETALNQVHANDDLRNKALRPMQQLKISIAGLSSIPQIRYLAERAGTHLDTAMEVLLPHKNSLLPASKNLALAIRVRCRKNPLK